jgi:hypothetical protein
MLIYVSTNNPFSKINPGSIPGSISFMHGLKFAENLQFYQSDRQKLKTIYIPVMRHTTSDNSSRSTLIAKSENMDRTSNDFRELLLLIH